MSDLAHIARYKRGDYDMHIRPLSRPVKAANINQIITSLTSVFSAILTLLEVLTTTANFIGTVSEMIKGEEE